MTLSGEDNSPGLAMVMLKVAKLLSIHMTAVAQLAFTLMLNHRYDAHGVAKRIR
jgi:hypothetical protein